MSRNIPAVRRWRVRHWQNGRMIGCYLVDAPNKRFAQWAARDQWLVNYGRQKSSELRRLMWPDRVTVSLHPFQR